MKNLNTNHRTLLENLTTFRRQQRCYEETNEYVRDVLNDLRAAFLSGGNPCYRFDLHGDDQSGRYFSADFYPNARGTEMPLVSIGFEKFDISSLLVDDDIEQCYAWVYSDLAEEPTGVVASNLLQFPSPEGFDPTPEVGGYLFTKDLGKLSVDDFLNPSTIRSYFERPLRVLIDWVIASSPQLEAIAKEVSS